MPQLRAHTSATCLTAHWPAAFFFEQKSGLLAGASAQAFAELGGCGGGELPPNAANGTPLAFSLRRKESQKDTPPKVATNAAQPQASTSQQVPQRDRAPAPPTCWYFRGRRRLRTGRLPSCSSSMRLSSPRSCVCVRFSLSLSLCLSVCLCLSHLYVCLIHSLVRSRRCLSALRV